MELKISCRYLVFVDGILKEIEIRKFSTSKKYIKIALSNEWKEGIPVTIWMNTKETQEFIIEELEDEIPMNLEREETLGSGFDIDNLVCPECFKIEKNYDSKQKEYILVKCDRCNYLMGLISK